MLISIGLALVALGIVSVVFGDKVLPAKDGVVSRAVSWPKGRARWMKYIIGAALIYAGGQVVYIAVVG